MSNEKRREAIIRVAPYSDGSGYQAVVRAWVEDSAPVFSVEITYYISADVWPELREAITDAIRLVAVPAL